jgi:hypothetical protein
VYCFVSSSFQFLLKGTEKAVKNAPFSISCDVEVLNNPKRRNQVLCSPGLNILPTILSNKVVNTSTTLLVKETFQWGSGGWEAEACTPPPGVLLRYLWGLCLMSRLI